MYQLIDYETRSFAPLERVGSLNYAKDPSTQILCVASQKGIEDIEVLDQVGPTHETLVSWGRFDYYIFREKEFPYYPSRNWVDMEALSRYLGMPGGLDAAAQVFGIAHRKDRRGKALIKKWCYDPSLVIPLDEMLAIREYCKQDLVVMSELWKILGPVLPEWTKHCRPAYEAYQRMNERGVPIDVNSVRAALFQCEQHENELASEMRLLAGLNPTQNVELAKLLEMPSIAKRELEAAAFSDPKLRRIADIRLEFAKAATKKLKPMLELARPTGRAHGCFVFNGAHTGRGSSRDIQFQNLKRSKVAPWVFKKLREAERLPNPLKDVGENIRGFIYNPKRQLAIADYAQVEARIVAWMADETILLDSFRAGRDVYKEFASRAYRMALEDVGDLERTYGKIVVLGAGYGAGGEKLAEQALGYGIKMLPEQGEALKRTYRKLYSRIPQMWADLDDAVAQVVTGRIRKASVAKCEFALLPGGKILALKLPSGRILRYFHPHLDQDGLTFMSKYGRKKIWGGHWTENIAQAIATDLKNDAMIRLDSLGIQLIAEVHDEIIAEVDHPRDLDTMLVVMQDAPKWIPEDLIRAEGKVVERYTK